MNEYRWIGVSTSPGIRHVLPVDDLQEHERTAFCWCRPAIEQPAKGQTIVVHNSKDGRELVEQHGLN